MRIGKVRKKKKIEALAMNFWLSTGLCSKQEGKNLFFEQVFSVSSPERSSIWLRSSGRFMNKENYCAF
jgi:hypothetical protein